MADGLSVAASVAGLITIADVIVRKGYKYIKEVKDAENSISKLIYQVNLLSGVLHSLQNIAQRFEDDAAGFDPTIQIHYVESCYQTLQSITKALEEADPARAKTASEITKQKLKWPLTRSRTVELLLEIESHKSAMTLAMSADGMSALLELLARQTVMREDLDKLGRIIETDRVQRTQVIITEERKKMLSLLGDVNAQRWQDSNIQLRQPCTGIWFTDGTEFKDWLSTDGSKLWIYGIPGAGKTVLISSIVQELQKNKHVSQAVTFFYCDYKDASTHEPINILGSLAKQLALQNETCFEDLEVFYGSRTTNDRYHREVTAVEVHELITQMAKRFSSMMIIVDGLDEISKNRSDVTKLLQGLQSTSGNIKTLFSSRLEVDIERHLEKYVKVSIAAKSSDISLYVASEIEIRTRDKKLRIRDPDLKEHIMKTLTEGAEGMFRWVACQMDYLCECTNDRDRRQALKQLPPDLPSSYERILHRLNKSSKQNQTLVVRCLQWIVYAKRPLSMNEILQALSVEDDDVDLERSALSTEEDVLHWCSSLVRRRTAGRVGLELAHFTVKEFLLAIDESNWPGLIQYQLKKTKAEILLGATCLRFLNFEFLGRIPLPNNHDDDEEMAVFLDNLREYDFINYAAKFWDHHSYQHIDDCQDIRELAFKLFNPAGCKQFHIWKIFRHVILNGEYPTSGNDDTSPLHWAASLALDGVCAWLIEQGLDVDGNSNFGTPLECAISSDAIFSGDIEALDEVPESRTWRAGSRVTVVEQLIRAGAKHNLMPGSDLRRTYIDLALDIEFWQDGDRAVSEALFDAGCLLLREEIDQLTHLLLDTWEDVYGSDEKPYDPNLDLHCVEHIIIVRGWNENLDSDARVAILRLALFVAGRGLVPRVLLAAFSFESMLQVTHIYQELIDLLNLSPLARKPLLLNFLIRLVHATNDDSDSPMVALDEALIVALKAFRFDIAEHLMQERLRSHLNLP